MHTSCPLSCWHTCVPTQYNLDMNLHLAQQWREVRDLQVDRDSRSYEWSIRERRQPLPPVKPTWHIRHPRIVQDIDYPVSPTNAKKNFEISIRGSQVSRWCISWSTQRYHHQKQTWPLDEVRSLLGNWESVDGILGTTSHTKKYINLTDKRNPTALFIRAEATEHTHLSAVESARAERDKYFHPIQYGKYEPISPAIIFNNDPWQVKRTFKQS